MQEDDNLMMLECNSTLFSVPLTPRRESLSWLYDSIDLGDLDIIVTGDDIPDDGDEEIIVDKVVAVVVLVVTALLGNCLVIFSVICNKAMRSAVIE